MKNSRSNKSSSQQNSSKIILITHIDQKQKAAAFNEANIRCEKSSLSSVLITQRFINDLFLEASKKISERKLIKTHLNNYAGKFMSSYVNQSVRLHLQTKPYEKSLTEEQQPVALKSDNLIPVGTNIESAKLQIPPKNSISPIQGFSKISRSMSTISRISKQPNGNITQSKKTPKVYEYIKLKQQDLPKLQTSFDPMIEELRRLKEAKNNEKALSKQVTKKTNLGNLKPDEKIGFDYGGEAFKIKQASQKSNFAASSIEGQQNDSLTKKEKQPKIDTNPINLDINAKKDNSKKALSKKAIEIEFSSITSLTPHLDVTDGVKFIHNKNVLENKKKQPSIGQLKKSISNRKLSRREFDKLKTLDDDISIRMKGQSPSLPTILKSQSDFSITKNQSILARSVSEAKFDQKSSSNYKSRSRKMFPQKFNQRISIQNEQLTEFLLENTYNSLQDMAILRIPEQQKKQHSKLQTLSSRDKANLHYIQTGIVGNIQLPKISYRINPSKQPRLITLLQSKTNLKGKIKQNEFQRLKKHFEDKLRI